MEGEQAVSTIDTSSPTSKKSEFSGGTADLECDVADEFSSASARYAGSPKARMERRGTALHGTVDMEGEQAVSTIDTSSPTSKKSEFSGGTADLECDVADEFSSASARYTGSPKAMMERRGSLTPGWGWSDERRGSLTPHKSADRVEYDPRNPVFVRPATELEKASADVELLRRQLARFKPAVARRSKEDPHCPIVRDYQRKAMAMEAALGRAEMTRAFIASRGSGPWLPTAGASDHRRGDSTCSTSAASSLSDIGAEEVSGVALPARML